MHLVFNSFELDFSVWPRPWDGWDLFIECNGIGGGYFNFDPHGWNKVKNWGAKRVKVRNKGEIMAWSEITVWCGSLRVDYTLPGWVHRRPRLIAAIDSLADGWERVGRKIEARHAAKLA